MVLPRSMRTVAVCLVAALVPLTLTSCATLVMDFNVTLTPTALSVAAGQEGEVTVTISHLIPIDVVPMPITVTIHDPPDFITSQVLDMPAGITSDELTFTVAPGAPLGGPVIVEVRASNGMKTKELTFELTVIAAP